jgi:hypothetical protein
MHGTKILNTAVLKSSKYSIVNNQHLSKNFYFGKRIFQTTLTFQLEQYN